MKEIDHAVPAFVALGSNLGNRRLYLQRAVELLELNPRIRLEAVSSCYESEPVGGPPGQRPFFNAAVRLNTDLGPHELLEVLLDVEQRLGRVRRDQNGPRTIDLDLLLVGDAVVESPELILPHPRMYGRLFVLEPLVEIAGDVIHPKLGATMEELLGNTRKSDPVTARDMQQNRFLLARNPGRELAGLRAMITGSSSGIGEAIAMELASAGAQVIIHRRDPVLSPDEEVRSVEEELADVAAAIARLGPKPEILLADLHSPIQRQQLVERAWSFWNGIDIWINNAGADILTRERASWPFERKLEELLAVDVRATIHISREVGRRMQAEGGGVILNMGWDQAETGMEGESGQLFAGVKAAVMAFSKSLALSLAPQVRVNCLAPGWIRTRWGEHASAYWQERVRRETPQGRWGTPEDVAATARWLASPAVSFITGQVVRVNGGAVR